MPKKKAHTVSVRVNDTTYQQAEEKARREGVSISSVLRAFLHLWAHDETPKGYPPSIPELDQRAPELRPRRRRKPPAEDDSDGNAGS